MSGFEISAGDSGRSSHQGQRWWQSRSVLHSVEMAVKMLDVVVVEDKMDCRMARDRQTTLPPIVRAIQGQAGTCRNSKPQKFPLARPYPLFTSQHELEFLEDIRAIRLSGLRLHIWSTVNSTSRAPPPSLRLLGFAS